MKLTRFLSSVYLAALLSVTSLMLSSEDARAQPRSEASPEVVQADAVLNFAEMSCEYRKNPLGIDAPAPRLTWKLSSEARGARQTAYHIQVSEGGDTFSEDNVVWDTGKVNSDQSAHHAYDGSPLQSRERYYWRVKVWDEGGEATAWSAPQWWEMGLLRASDWEAEWIEPGWEEDTTASPPSPTMRSAFSVDGDVASARLYVTAHGLYEMYVNGEVVSDELFTPGWTSYDTRLQYQTFDVGEQLRQGENVIGAMLGDGWYRGFLGWGDQRNTYGQTLALLAQLEVTYENGETEIVSRTQDGWQATPEGPIRASDIYNGETYDARREMPGWSTPDYDASSWSGGVRTADYSKDILIAPADPPTRRIQTLRPMRIFETPEGDTIVDMGQNMVGWVRLHVEGEAGTEVTLRHAEVLDKEGNFYDANLRGADAETHYILSGEGEEVYEPRFTFHGFRYVAVDNYPGELTLGDLEGVVIHSDIAPAGHFESSNALINQLQSNILWGQKGNFLDVPTDTPARDERLGWTGDAQVFVETSTYNMDVAAFFTKWLRDLAADQYDDGSIPHVVPNVLGGFGGQKAAGATGWADAGVIIPWVLYERYDDTRVLEGQYESMKAWIEYMRENAQIDEDTYIWDQGFHFGDWLAYNTTQSDYPGATTEKDLIATAYFAHSAQLFSQIAEVLGRSDDAEAYAELAENIREAFRDEFVTGRGRVTSSTQTAYVLALAFDLLSEEQEQSAASRLAADVRNRGHLTTGFLGTPDLLHMLSQHGYYDEAYSLLMRTEYPSWLYPVTRGATTMWERWDGVKPDSTFQDVGMNSFNHYAYGAVGDWLHREVAGIEAAAPGYKHVRIAPKPGGGLTHARGRFESIHGPIESSWRFDGETFHLDVHIPANARSTVHLPGASAADGVREGNASLIEAAGIEQVREENGTVVVEVGAGQYAFAYTPSESLVQAPDASEQKSFSAESTLAELMADAEARQVIAEELPQLYDSPWLSQAMNFPLARAGDVIPVLDLSESELQSAGEALQRLGM